MNRPWPFGMRKANRGSDLKAFPADGTDGAPLVHGTGALQSGVKSLTKRSCCSLSERKHQFMSRLRGKMEFLLPRTQVIR